MDKKNILSAKNPHPLPSSPASDPASLSESPNLEQGETRRVWVDRKSNSTENISPQMVSVKNIISSKGTERNAARAVYNKTRSLSRRKVRKGSVGVWFEAALRDVKEESKGDVFFRLINNRELLVTKRPLSTRETHPSVAGSDSSLTSPATSLKRSPPSPELPANPSERAPAEKVNQKSDLSENISPQTDDVNDDSIALWATE